MTFHELVAEIKKNITECTVEDVKNMKSSNEDFILVDTREESEFAEGRIKGAIHIGRGIIERDIHLHIPDKEQKVVLYCGGGFRSALAAHNLQLMGYSNIISMDGGWKGWLNSQGETE